MFTRPRVVVTTVAALTLAALSACSSGTPSAPGYGPASSAPASSVPASSAPASSAPASEPASSMPASVPASGADAATLALGMADTSLGSVLVDGKGMTLYMFATDSPNTSTCTGPCLVKWPALAGKPTAGSGVDDSKLGSFQRDDGSTQASYNGWPLYYWQGDAAPGDVSGQGVGGNWWVLDRDGDPVKS